MAGFDIKEYIMFHTQNPTRFPANVLHGGSTSSVTLLHLRPNAINGQPLGSSDFLSIPGTSQGSGGIKNT